MEARTHITRRRMLAAAGAAGAAALGGDVAAAQQPDKGQKQPPKKKAVRIAMSAAVANDLKKLHAGIVDLAERLGCRKCFSGFDCTFRIELDRKPHYQIADGQPPKVSAPDPDGDPARAVTVHLGKKVSTNIDRLKDAVASIADRLGHRNCFSGFDVAFLQQIRFLGINDDLKVQDVTRDVPDFLRA